MSWFLTNLISEFLLPPLNLLLGQKAIPTTHWKMRATAARFCKQAMLNASSWSHTPGAAAAFTTAGFQVIPAPTAIHDAAHNQTDLLAFVPNAIALRDSKIFMHEIIGIFWYRLKS